MLVGLYLFMGFVRCLEFMYWFFIKRAYPMKDRQN